MPGHLFVFRGDLTRLACDAVILPCDDRLNITDVWRPLLPPGLGPGDSSRWLRLPADNREGDVVRLPDVDRRLVRAVVTTPTDGPAPTPETVADRIVAGIRAAGKDLKPRDGRERPLVALPLVGTGTGGLRHRRGEVIDALLLRLRAAAQEIDIALVLWDSRDVAAVQHRRSDNIDWTELTVQLRNTADHLGQLAGHGRLSLFIGAGVSKPVGLPDWSTLLKDLADEAGVCFDAEASTDLVEAATPIVDELGSRFHQVVTKRLESSTHGIGHALLAGLRVQQMVTTNFDACMELAMDKALDGRYRVLTRKLADSSMPWLLKLHGDIRQPGSLVLSAVHYQTHPKEYAALHGVVQSLMLTSHLLFVGFSMTDQNFLSMAAAVARVRKDAEREHGHALPTAGTALALTRSRVKKDLEKELDFIPMTESDSDKSAARILEIFLDRLAWTAARTHQLAAEYLLDDRYASALNEPDRALRDALVGLQANLPDAARRSAGWVRVKAMLTGLGGDSRP
jgi:hypothetical protein